MRWRWRVRVALLMLEMASEILQAPGSIAARSRHPAHESDWK